MWDLQIEKGEAVAMSACIICEEFVVLLCVLQRSNFAEIKQSQLRIVAFSYIASAVSLGRSFVDAAYVPLSKMFVLELSPLVVRIVVSCQ